jgi:hypothetical protein
VEELDDQLRVPSFEFGLVWFRVSFRAGHEDHAWSADPDYHRRLVFRFGRDLVAYGR